MKYATITWISVYLIAACSVHKTKDTASSEPWNQSQLIEADDLAKALNENSVAFPYIFAVNPDGMYNFPEGGGIKNAVVVGPTEDDANLDKLRQKLIGIDRDEKIVIYCGCCPFNMCPNIRPAFKLLNEMKFTNHKLLNLQNNIQEDWIAKGYPMNF